MHRIYNKFIHKGQLFGCPLFFKAIPFAIIAFLPACSKHQATTTLAESIAIKQNDFEAILNQAKNLDIATPVGYKLIKENTNDLSRQFFIYEGNHNINAASAFYARELETSGWNFKNLSTTEEGLFICGKPDKTCIVSIRPKEPSGSVICITMANNEMED